MEILTEKDKIKLLNLNSTRLDYIELFPLSERQSHYDSFVKDLNYCLTINDSLFTDLSILASIYNLNTDLKIN